MPTHDKSTVIHDESELVLFAMNHEESYLQGLECARTGEGWEKFHEYLHNRYARNVRPYFNGKGLKPRLIKALKEAFTEEVQHG